MKQEIKKTTIGGQALIEGILMRGPDKVAIVCRTPRGIEIKDEPVFTGKKPAWQTWPIVRGVVTLIESMKMGMSALMYSAEIVEFEEEDGPTWLEKHLPAGIRKWYLARQKTIDQWASILFSLLAALVLFFLVPTLLTGLIGRFIMHPFLLNLTEGLIRIGIFLAYVILIARMPEIHRVFGYHGAEHKTIHCYEHGDELTVANVRQYPIEHPRCGTSFLFNVMLISIIVLSFFGWPNPWVRMGVRLLTLPVIAGLAYEVNRAVGRSDGKIAQLVSMPGMWLQGTATVREPEDDQIEIAIIALQQVIPEKEGSDLW